MNLKKNGMLHKATHNMTLFYIFLVEERMGSQFCRYNNTLNTAWAGWVSEWAGGWLVGGCRGETRFSSPPSCT